MKRIADILLCLAPFGVGAGVARTYGLWEGIFAAVVLSGLVFLSLISRAMDAEDYFD